MTVGRTVISVLTGLLAVSVGVMSALHLGGVIHGGSPPYDEDAAGIAEAVIAVALAVGAIAVARAPFGRARAVGLGTVGFAILGFGIGLSITVRGGTTVDIAYHASTLPVLLLTAVLLLRWREHEKG